MQLMHVVLVHLIQLLLVMFPLGFRRELTVRKFPTEKHMVIFVVPTRELKTQLVEVHKVHALDKGLQRVLDSDQVQVQLPVGQVELHLLELQFGHRNEMDEVAEVLMRSWEKVLEA